MQKFLTIFQNCGATTKPCGWPEFIALINQFINLAIYLATLFAVFTFAWAGLKMLLSAGNSSEISAAKSMMLNATLGIIITMIAWLIVQFILTNVGLLSGYSLLS